MGEGREEMGEGREEMRETRLESRKDLIFGRAQYTIRNDNTIQWDRYQIFQFKYEKMSDLYLQIGKKTMFNQNTEEKKKSYRQLKQSLYIKDHYGGGIGLDCNRVYGHDMEHIKTQCKHLREAKKDKQLFYLSKIKEERDRLINNFLAKVKPIAYFFNPEDVYAVFDGETHQIQGKSKGFQWNLTPSTPSDRGVRGERSSNNSGKSTSLLEFWSIYSFIVHTLQFLLHSMGFHVILAPYEADHQICKMFYEGKIQCVFSNDYGYVDYGVPLVTTFDKFGEGLVIDFMKADLSLIEDNMLRMWVKDTRDIKDISSLMRRIHLGLLCEQKYIESFKNFPFYGLRALVSLWEPKKQEFFNFMKRISPDMHIPQGYYSRFQSVRLLFLLGTVYSLKKKRLEPLFDQMKGLLSEGNRQEIRLRREIVGNKRNYSPFSPLSYADEVPSLGDKLREEIEEMSIEEVNEWLFQQGQDKEWLSIDMNPEVIKCAGWL